MEGAGRPRAPPPGVGLGRSRPMVCCCVPLRTAVFLCAACTVLLSLALLASRGRAEAGVRVCTGGYALQSRVIVDLLEISGAVWGLVGAAGVWFLWSSYVRVFLAYQVVRLLAWLVMYLTDVPLLWTCELWRTNLREAAAQYGWNDVMHNIAMNSHCQQERTLFMLCSTVSVVCFVYLTLATHWFLAELEREPRHLLHVSKDHPPGAFYAASLSGPGALAQRPGARGAPAAAGP